MPFSEALRRALVVVLALLAGAIPAGAQSRDTNRVQPGDSVRVLTQGGFRIPARFHGWEGESMMLRVEGLDAPWKLSVYDMRALELHTERTRREGFRHGALLGAATGLFIGAVAGAALNAAGVTDDPDAPSDQIVTQAITGAVIGIGAGALAYGFHRGRNPGVGWVSVTLPTR